MDASGEHLKSIDGLKGIAACIVAFVWHYQHFKPQYGMPFDNIIPLSYKYGWIMVELFFILSGMGMMMGYGDKILKHTISFPAYMIKRVRKIYPLFLLSTILVTILQILYMRKMGETFVYANFDVYHLFLNLLLMQDGIVGIEWSFNSPSWCISICVFLYAIFYAIVYHVKEKRHVYYIFVLCGIGGLALILGGWDYPLLNVLIGRGMAGFSVGILLYGIYEKRTSFRADRLGVICLVGCIFLYLLLRMKGPEIFGDFRLSFLMGIGPMIVMSALFVPIINKMLSLGIFVLLGKISLGIYLLHFPVQCIIRVIDIYGNLNIEYSLHAVWILYALVTILTAWIYSTFIEKRWNYVLARLKHETEG